ncbi:hypothetical protein AB3S75_047554 [Citrus x aurantiifolia]
MVSYEVSIGLILIVRLKVFSDQGPGHKGPGTIQVRRTPDVIAMSRNLTHRPKRRANTRTATNAEHTTMPPVFISPRQRKWL